MLIDLLIVINKIYAILVCTLFPSSMVSNYIVLSQRILYCNKYLIFYLTNCKGTMLVMVVSDFYYTSLENIAFKINII